MTRRHAPGQSLVLLALILPFLAALVLASMELGARQWQRAQVEDALRQANRAAVQTWLYPAFAAGTVTVRSVDMVASGERYLQANLTNTSGLRSAPDVAVASAAWTPVVGFSGGPCPAPGGTTLTLPRPGMCATLTVTLRSLVSGQDWTTTVFVADTVDVLD